MPCRAAWQSWSMVGPRVQITELRGPGLWPRLPEAVEPERKGPLGGSLSLSKPLLTADCCLPVLLGPGAGCAKTRWLT